jgi:hypothetical protein
MTYKWLRDEDGLTYAQLKELAADPAATMDSRIYALKLVNQFESLFGSTFGVIKKIQ